MAAGLRVGSVPYVVGRPLDLGLGDEPGIELVHAVPARLVDGLRDGSIDVAMVSSIELFRGPGYGYLAGLAVAGRGYVGSVQLFLRRPLERVERVAFDPASRAAEALLRLLLADRPGGPPESVELAPDEDPREVAADAWLRIGDRALLELHREHLPHFNPSREWTRRTGLPFVFAPWIVRPGVDVEPFLGAFHRARERGAARVEAVIDEAALRAELPRAVLATYLGEECLYDLGDEMHESLTLFRDRAAEVGLCRPDLEPRAIGPRPGARAEHA